MAGTLIGYARCSTDEQDLTAQRNSLEALGVASDRIYLDHGVPVANGQDPTLEQVAVRCGGRRGRSMLRAGSNVSVRNESEWQAVLFAQVSGRVPAAR